MVSGRAIRVVLASSRGLRLEIGPTSSSGHTGPFLLFQYRPLARLTRVPLGHRLLGETGFLVTGERRSDDAICVHPVPVVIKRFRELWPDAHLFVDACYSTVGTKDDSNFDGHAGNPLYEEAIDRIAIWIEALILQQSARNLLE